MTRDLAAEAAREWAIVRDREMRSSLAEVRALLHQIDPGPWEGGLLEPILRLQRERDEARAEVARIRALAEEWTTGETSENWWCNTPTRAAQLAERRRCAKQVLTGTLPGPGKKR